jgi:hypothetical protein
MRTDRLARADVDKVLALTELSLSTEGFMLAGDDPVAWVEERLGEHPWSLQRDILYSVCNNRRTAVHAAHGVGKSYLAARVALWWIERDPVGDAFVVTTAPTYDQVRSILWREMAAAHRRGGLRGRIGGTEWSIDGALVAIGRKPADHDPAAFQGIHARRVLVVIDEAAGVPQALWEAAGTLTSNDESRILAIGNPDDPGSYFATVCAPGSGWSVYRIDAFASPNFTGEAIPEGVRELLVGPTWVEERALDWGVDSPLYIAKVRGEFPSSTTDNVVPLAFVRNCQREPSESSIAEAWARPTPVELGVDVGAGGDRTVICLRRGTRATIVWRGQTPDPSVVTGQVVRAINETGATRVKVDVVGIGWGIAGRLDELRREHVHSAEIVGVNVGEGARDPTRFAHLRDEIWWEVGRELSRTRGWDLRAIDEVAVGQLIAPRWEPDSAGRIRVEPKDETRKRLGRSPDDADALLLAFYDPGDLTDDLWVHRIWTCTNCGHLYPWRPARPCPACWVPGPADDPFAAGPNRWMAPADGPAELA